MSTALRLQTREQRKKLEPRDKPYFSDLRRGLSIGYRKGVEGGSWLLREFRGGKYVQRRLGAVDDDVPADGIAMLSWSDAQKLALDVERPTVTRSGKHTVAAAWDAYCVTRKTPSDARERATWERFIEPKLGSREVSELSHHELKKWLVDQVTTRGNRGQTIDGADEKDRLRRARYTANRRWNLLRAILNNSLESDAVKSDAAWRKVKPFAKVDRPRTVTVSAEQARALLTKIVEPLLGLAKGALYTGLRLGELIGLRVDDIDVAGAQVRVRHGKGGAERFIPLNREGASFFGERIKGRTATEAVFKPMDRMQVKRAMTAGCEVAQIVPRVTFHDLRRSYGSLMLNSGAPIESIQQVLGHADMRMTCRTYAHLLQKTVAKSVQKHLPSFDDSASKGRRPRKER
jgi:integrase